MPLHNTIPACGARAASLQGREPLAAAPGVQLGHGLGATPTDGGNPAASPAVADPMEGDVAAPRARGVGTEVVGRSGVVTPQAVNSRGDDDPIEIVPWACGTACVTHRQTKPPAVTATEGFGLNPIRRGARETSTRRLLSQQGRTM